MHALEGRTLTKLQSTRMKRILESTRRLLGEVGADGMTMRALAARSGVSAATLYNQFGTKDGVITQAVIDHYQSGVSNVLDRDRDTEMHTPLERIIQGALVIVRDLRRNQSFGKALMSTYFKIGNEREMPSRLYDSLYQTWLPSLKEMKAAGSLHDWAAVPLLCEELCDRMFGVIMKWAQGLIPLASLADQTQLSLLSTLAGHLRGEQSEETSKHLRELSLKLSKRRRPSRS